MSARTIAPAPAGLSKALHQLAAASLAALRVFVGALVIAVLLVAGLGATLGSALLPAAAALAQALGQRLAWIGPPLMLAGVFLAAWAAWCLHRARPHDKQGRAVGVPAVLVDHGPYRYVRHPIWAAGLLTLLAATPVLAHPEPALLALGLWALARWRWIPAEEQRLAQRFGGWWRDYAATVPRGL